MDVSILTLHNKENSYAYEYISNVYSFLQPLNIYLFIYGICLLTIFFLSFIQHTQLTLELPRLFSTGKAGLHPGLINRTLGRNMNRSEGGPVFVVHRVVATQHGSHERLCNWNGRLQIKYCRISCRQINIGREIPEDPHCGLRPGVSLHYDKRKSNLCIRTHSTPRHKHGLCLALFRMTELFYPPLKFSETCPEHVSELEVFFFLYFSCEYWKHSLFVWCILGFRRISTSVLNL